MLASALLPKTHLRPRICQSNYSLPSPFQPQKNSPLFFPSAISCVALLMRRPAYSQSFFNLLCQPQRIGVLLPPCPTITSCADSLLISFCFFLFEMLRFCHILRRVPPLGCRHRHSHVGTHPGNPPLSSPCPSTALISAPLVADLLP